MEKNPDQKVGMMQVQNTQRKMLKELPVNWSKKWLELNQCSFEKCTTQMKNAFKKIKKMHFESFESASL